MTDRPDTAPFRNADAYEAAGHPELAERLRDTARAMADNPGDAAAPTPDDDYRQQLHSAITDARIWTADGGTWGYADADEITAAVLTVRDRHMEQLAQVREYVERSDNDGARTRENILRILGDGDGTHYYLSTGCLHGEHGYCRNARGQAGPKKPGVCKFCEGKCRCYCHRDAP